MARSTTGSAIARRAGQSRFHASYIEAHETLRAPNSDRFRSLVIAYRSSPDFKNLAPSTKKAWDPWLDRIAEHFGDLRIAQFERPQKIKPVIIQWRNQFADTQRAADSALQVLSRVLAHATNALGRVSGNPCEGIKTLYRGDRSEIIWTESDVAKLKCTCSSEVAHATDLAAYTGLRLGDIVRLAWSHIGEDEIVIATGKSRHRRSARVPLYDDLRAVLAGIPRRSTTVLTHSMGRPWAAKSLGNAFTQAKNAAGFLDLHFHDLRGTAATKFYLAGLPEHLIAEIMGWEPEHVSKIIRRYVDRSTVIKAAIVQLNEAKAQKAIRPDKTTVKPKD